MVSLVWIFQILLSSIQSIAKIPKYIYTNQDRFLLVDLLDFSTQIFLAYSTIQVCPLVKISCFSKLCNYLLGLNVHIYALKFYSSILASSRTHCKNFTSRSTVQHHEQVHLPLYCPKQDLSRTISRDQY
jgi:hypothetical protein